MKKFLLAGFIAAVGLCGCRSTEATISGKLLGVNSKSVYLEQVSALNQSIIDSTTLAEDGSYRFHMQNVAQTPTIYNLVYSGERVPLLVKGGDKITVNSLGNPQQNYTVDGSAESELLRQFNCQYVAGLEALDSIAARYATADEDSLKRNIQRSYGARYRDLKRNQISFIVENKSKIAAIYALYQRLPGEQYLAGAESDIIYFRTVADAVTESYPESPYLPTLRNEVARMEARNSLIQSIHESSYPDIEAPDMYGHKIKLSSLTGKVILVDFWSAEAGNSNALNADMKEIYKKYADRGFEIYQVSLDTSKAKWVQAVQEQQLPWISVCDFRGQASPILGLYNVRKLPSNYLIDRSGTIIGKDLYSTALDKQLLQLFQ